MKVHLINQYKDQFIQYLESAKYIDNAFYFEIIENWQSNWDIEDLSFDTMYDSSLQSKFSGRLWGGSENSAKSMMMQMINSEKEFMRSAFRDLLADHKDLGLRLDRFGYHADQVFGALQSTNKKLSDHYHHDRKILCLYLALQFPDLYCLFNYKAFVKMMTLIESKNIPTEAEVERYYKSCRGICKLISKDEKLLLALKKHIPQIDPDQFQLMIMPIFMEFIEANA